jgi:Cellulose binding domain
VSRSKGAYHATVAHADQPNTKVPGRRRRVYRPYWYPRLSVGAVTILAVLALGVGVPLFSLLTRPSDPFAPGAGHSDDPASVVRLPVAPPSVGSTDSPLPSDAGVPPSATLWSPSANPSSAATMPVPAPARAPLRATYTTLITRGPQGAKGYDGQVTITNPGGTPATWTVTITVYPGQQVTYASGAAYRQDGTTVTFTGTAPVPALGSVKFRYGVDSKVLDPPGPVACDINGRQCN